MPPKEYRDIEGACRNEAQCSRPMSPWEILDTYAKELREKAHAAEKLADQFRGVRLSIESQEILADIFRRGFAR